MKKRVLALLLAVTLSFSMTGESVYAVSAEIQREEEAETLFTNKKEESNSADDSALQKADGNFSEPEEQITPLELLEESTTEESAVLIDNSIFPDQSFENFIREFADTDSDGYLTQAEIAGVTALDVSGKDIASLQGIEIFTELETLTCSNNSLIELDVTALTKLTTLTCENNKTAVVVDENNRFTLPFTIADNDSRIKNLTGALRKGNVFTATAESVSYTYDAGNQFQIEVSVQLDKFRKDISQAMVAKISNVTYTGNAIKPEITLTYQGTVIPKTDYTVTYQNNVNVGTAQAIITGKNNFLGTKQTSFKILPKSIAKLSCSKISNKTYTGRAIKPSITLKDGKKKLKLKTDYTITYKNNKQTGKASIQLKGKGNYKGTRKLTFKILPKKVASFKAAERTSATIKLKWKKSASVTGYQIYQYNTKTRKYKKIKTIKAKTTSITVKNLSPCTTYRFKIRAYKKSGKSMYYGAYSKVLKVQTRLETPHMEVTSTRMGQAVVSWKKVSKASGLELSYRKGSEGYQTISNVTKNQNDRLFVSELQEGAAYTFRMRAYRVTDGKKVYSDYCNKTVVISSQGSVLSGGDYTPGSVYGPSLSQGELDQVREKVQYFKDHYIDDSMSDFLKVKMAHDYLASVCSYAPDWSLNRANTAWGALVYGEAQCSGYARAMKALCDGIGIGCYYVHADANASNPSHQWNEVCVDGKWYIIDVQCNDSSGFYAVFLVSDTTYANMSGMSWDRNSVPACPEDYQW